MGKPKGNAVRIYTLNERATKFRNTAACLSWSEKTGSAEKKAYIMSLLPPGATDTRSLGGDLTKFQQEQLIAPNKGKFPNRRRKSKRTLEAQAPMAIPASGFQAQPPPVEGEVERESDDLRSQIEQSRLEGQAAQPINRNGSTNHNGLGALGRGSQLDAPQNTVGQDLNISLSAGGVSHNGYYGTQNNSRTANLVPPSQLDASQIFPNNGGAWSSLNNQRGTNEIGFYNQAQHGAAYGAQPAGGEYPAAGEARGFAALQAQSHRQVNNPVDTPVQRQKRPRTAPAEEEAESHDNRRNKRARTAAPVATPQVSSPSESFGGEAESLLHFDENGFVIQHNTPGMQGQAEYMYPATFDKFLRDTQYRDNHAEDDAPYETDDAPAIQESDRLLDTPASLPTQGRKRRRPSPTENVEEGDVGPKSKRSRRDGDVRPLAKSIDEASPVQVSRGQKRARGSSQSRGDPDSDLESPPAKRQKASPSPEESSAPDGDESTDNDEEASSSDSNHSSDADSDDGSEYNRSPYHQTSLKTIARPTTGGKGPYKPNGRPVTGGKGPLKSSTRVNVARKAPRKQ